jgi:hypothetical protein
MDDLVLFSGTLGIFTCGVPVDTLYWGWKANVGSLVYETRGLPLSRYSLFHESRRICSIPPKMASAHCFVQAVRAQSMKSAYT